MDTGWPMFSLAMMACTDGCLFLNLLWSSSKLDIVEGCDWLAAPYGGCSQFARSHNYSVSFILEIVNERSHLSYINSVLVEKLFC